MTDEAATLIRIRGLTNRFGPRTVHDNLDLDIQQGEILGVVGGSGTGKSVLLRSIIGLHKPDAGKIQVMTDRLQHHQVVPQTLGLACSYGVLFQQGALLSSLTVQENVALPLIEQAHLRRPEAEHLARLKLAMVGLAPDAATKYPSELSGGMIKRTALARALALDPEVLFLDEPTAGLDPVGAAAFDELLLTLRDALNLTVFLVTHDLDTLYAVCDRVAALAERRVLIADRLPVVAAYDHPWIQAYFHGPRSRSAQHGAQPLESV